MQRHDFRRREIERVAGSRRQVTLRFVRRHIEGGEVLGRAVNHKRRSQLAISLHIHGRPE
jgi:hypothetical protein